MYQLQDVSFDNIQRRTRNGCFGAKACSREDNEGLSMHFITAVLISQAGFVDIAPIQELLFNVRNML